MFTSNKIFRFAALMALGSLFFACEEDEPTTRPELQVPDTYTSANFAANTATEQVVIEELGSLVSDLNSIEADGTPAEITYPATLESITLGNYAARINDWLDEVEKAAGNEFDLENAPAGEGGVLGTRLLDEYGLELEQMIDKGSFGAALYNHALDVLSDPVTEASVDQLVKTFGTDPTFNPDATRFAATYAKRRSDNEAETGYLYDIEDNLITARAAVTAGPEYDPELSAALSSFLLNWEESNFATVIFYANATKVQIREAGDDPVALGNAMHAYAEAVGFSAGWKELPNKKITDSEIDQILALLLAEEGQNPESYRFLKEPDLLVNFDQIIDLIQDVYGFTDAEVADFYVNG
ncbi:MAG: hypothetical protein ACLFOZ_02525 [Cyclobacteriaceae bacterium]